MNLNHDASVTTRGHIQMHLSICNQIHGAILLYLLIDFSEGWSIKLLVVSITLFSQNIIAHRRQLEPQFLNIHKCVQNSDDIKEFGVVNWQYKK